MGRVKDWMMSVQEREIDRLLNENPEMSAEEAHTIVCEDPYHLYEPCICPGIEEIHIEDRLWQFKWRTDNEPASVLVKSRAAKRSRNH